MGSRWPIVGRDAATAEFTMSLGRPDSAGLLLTGPIGVGKTRLLDEFLAIAAKRHLRTERISATETMLNIPLGPFARLVPSDVELGPFVGVSALQRCRDSLAVPGAPRLVLGVDDVHLLDSASAALVYQLVEEDGAYLIATWRNGERAPDALTSLWKDGRCDRIELDPLSHHEVADLVSAALGGTIESQSALRLARISNGNPLFLRELVTSAVRSGTLAQVGPEFRLNGDPSIPAALHEVVQDRLSLLGPDQLDALRFVAFGDPLDIEIALRNCELDDLEQLEEAGLVAVSQVDFETTVVTMAHPLHRQVVRSGASQLQARQIMLKLASDLASQPQSRGDALRIALWQLDAGAGPEVETLVQGAQQAMSASDHDTAARLAEVAWAANGSVAAGLVLAEVHFENGSIDLLDDLLDALRPEVATNEERTLWALLQAYSSYWHHGDSALALRQLDEASQSLDEEAMIAELDGFRCQIEATSGRVDSAISRSFVHLDGPPKRAFVHAGLAAGLALPMAGRASEVHDIARRTTDVHQSIRTGTALYQPSILGVTEVTALLADGYLELARERVVECYERALREGDAAGWAFFGASRGHAALEVGDQHDGLRWFVESAGLFRLANHLGAMRWSLAGVVLCSIGTNDLVGADAALAEIDSISHDASYYEESVDRARGRLAAARGQIPEAQSAINEGYERAIGRGHLEPALACLHDLARLGLAGSEHLEAAHGLQSQISGRYAPVRLRHIEASVKKDHEALPACADELEEMGAILGAAEACSLAARFAERGGYQRRAARLDHRTSELLATIGNPASPAIVKIASPTPLTKRELDIARLAAKGHSSNEIAEALSLSRRTVDNHLGRVYSKLGISSRRDLADLVD